jgi:O-antigen ligase
MGLYILFVILSAIFAEYKNVAFYGFPDRYEGMFIIFAYLIVTFIAINIIVTKKQLKFLLGGLFFSASIICIIGLSQFLGFNLLESVFIKNLTLPIRYHFLSSEINFNNYSIYSTLYNPNYVGSYTAMLFPISIGFFIWFKDIKYKISFGIFSCLIFSNWTGCHSRAGIIGGLFAVIIIMIFFRKYLKKNLYYLITLIIFYTLIFTGMNFYSNNYLFSKFSSLEAEFKNLLSKNNTSERLEDLVIENNKISLISQSKTLNIIYKNKLIFTDTNNNNLQTYKSKDTITFLNNNYKEYLIQKTKNNLLKIKTNYYTVFFGHTKEGFKIYDKRTGFHELTHVEKWGFDNKEKLGSGRGYIWSRSLPLLKDTIILGHGPDTFSIYFPQNDYVGKIIAFGKATPIVDKPHNLYLQVGINTGLLSLLAFLSIFVFYFISTIKIYLKNYDYDNLFSVTGITFFAAILGYLITGFFNDSTISVAPVFWVLLGTGIAVNKKNINNLTSY